jgi:hypothetical protein
MQPEGCNPSGGPLRHADGLVAGREFAGHVERVVGDPDASSARKRNRYLNGNP